MANRLLQSARLIQPRLQLDAESSFPFPPLQETRGQPFLKGKILKSGEESKGVFSRSLVFRDSNDELGEKGSSGLGVLDLMGFRAKAWDCKLMDMEGAELKEQKVAPLKEGLNGARKGDVEDTIDKRAALFLVENEGVGSWRLMMGVEGGRRRSRREVDFDTVAIVLAPFAMRSSRRSKFKKHLFFFFWIINGILQPWTIFF